MSLPQIYLISPPSFELASFAKRLDNSLKTGLVPIFQLRLKDYNEIEVKNIALRLQKICQQNNCKFVINDFHNVALDIGADGVHLGADDADILSVRKNSPHNFFIGASCYDSKDLAVKAVKDGADSISFGAFFTSNTKKSRGRPDVGILEWATKEISKPISVIGGIDVLNCRTFLPYKVDYLCIISAIWNHAKGEVFAIKEISDCLKLDH